MQCQNHDTPAPDRISIDYHRSSCDVDQSLSHQRDRNIAIIQKTQNTHSIIYKAILNRRVYAPTE